MLSFRKAPDVDVELEVVIRAYLPRFKIGSFQYNIGSFEYLYWIYPIFRSGHFPILLRPSPQYWIDPIPLFDRSNSSYLRIVLIRGPTLGRKKDPLRPPGGPGQPAARSLLASGG